MKKSVVLLVAGAALCTPSVTFAAHYTNLMMQEYSSMEECDAARAEFRRNETEGVRGKERGMFNKNFNSNYRCEQTEGMNTSTTTDDVYMITDR